MDKFEAEQPSACCIKGANELLKYIETFPQMLLLNV
jgi:hypothetical protein